MRPVGAAGGEGASGGAAVGVGGVGGGGAAGARAARGGTAAGVGASVELGALQRYKAQAVQLQRQVALLSEELQVGVQGLVAQGLGSGKKAYQSEGGDG